MGGRRIYKIKKQQQQQQGEKVGKMNFSLALVTLKKKERCFRCEKKKLLSHFTQSVATLCSEAGGVEWIIFC